MADDKKCSKCGKDIEEGKECSCEEGVCDKCCSCDPKCNCGCKKDENE